MTKPQRAVILVAGRGERMRPLTDKTPKCLIEIKGKAILMNALEILERNDIKETILVVGHLGERIKEAAGERLGGMKITCIDNELYDKTNNSYSLWLAIRELKEDLLILEGDIFFEKGLLEKFLGDEREDSTVVEKYKPGLDGTFVEVGKDGKILSWVHKKDRPEGFTLEDKYKTVNIHKFSADFVEGWIKPVLKKHIEENQGSEPIEFIFSQIIKNDGKIHAFDCQGFSWVEVDDINDLKEANEKFQ